MVFLGDLIVFIEMAYILYLYTNTNMKNHCDLVCKHVNLLLYFLTDIVTTDYNSKSLTVILYYQPKLMCQY